MTMEDNVAQEFGAQRNKVGEIVRTQESWSFSLVSET